MPLTSSPTPAISKTKVLLIDDQPLIAEALRRMLIDHADIEFRYVADANRALETAIEFAPTVILQDLVMPVVDGFDMVKRYRQHPALTHVPVIVLSTREDPETKAQGFAIGANDYLVKWPDKIELLARVRHLSASYINRVQRDAAFRALADSEKKLAEANAELKKFSKLKDEFISTVSHELRTPLTSIRGSLALLVDGAVGELPAPAKNLLDIANASCDRLVRLINDLLDIEKIESGKMQFDMKVHPLLPLVRQSIDATQGYAAQFHVGLRLTADDIEVQVEMDSDRIMQVLVNLLSNAIKFSPKGATVEVHVARHGDKVRITVSDVGDGIPEAFRARVFEKFAQADSGNARKHGGTGLGLSICKRIVEQHHGHISFRTASGEGTQFYVDLPVVSQP